MLVRRPTLPAIAGAFVACLVSTTAIAEPIPQEYLDGEYQNCMQQSASSQFSQDQRERYCSCTVEQFSQMHFEQYLEINGQVLEQNLSAETTTYLQGVHEVCKPHLSQ